MSDAKISLIRKKLLKEHNHQIRIIQLLKIKMRCTWNLLESCKRMFKDSKIQKEMKIGWDQ